MNKILITLSIAFLTITGSAQKTYSESILELSDFYSTYMFMNDSPKEVRQTLESNGTEEFSKAIKFIVECSKQNNNILEKEYLTLPDTKTLRIIFIIDALHQNPSRKIVIDKEILIDSLKTSIIPNPELVDEYYSTLFTAVSNKNKPFNLSKENFDLNDYNLNTDLNKGIFYLRCMNVCGKQIMGYMQYAKPPNTKKALQYIAKFPKFNNSPYYVFNSFGFPDFSMEIYNDQGLKSYKGHFINDLYTTLIYHVIALNKEGKSQKEINNLLLGSILKDKSLYKYTTHAEYIKRFYSEQ